MGKSKRLALTELPGVAGEAARMIPAPFEGAVEIVLVKETGSARVLARSWEHFSPTPDWWVTVQTEFYDIVYVFSTQEYGWEEFLSIRGEKTPELEAWASKWGAEWRASQ